MQWNVYKTSTSFQRHIIVWYDMHVISYDRYVILLDSIFISSVGLVSPVPCPYRGNGIVLCGLDVALKPLFAEKRSSACPTSVLPAVVLPFGHLKRRGRSKHNSGQ
jgi:hypothetical protein